MTQLVTIFGGAGFLGRYIARRMAQAGWRVRVVTRSPNQAMFVRTYGAVGQVEPVFGNIRDDASVLAAVTGADTVVNCVSTFDLGGKNSFQVINVAGADRIARLAAQAGVARMVQISAIGADPDSPSEYGRTKAAGEEAVLAHMPAALILRPSIMFGPEDDFFNRFAGMSRFGPILPVIGADTRFQPVYVDDVAQAVVLGITARGPTGVYELGGPDVRTFRELMTDMLALIRRRRLVINLPFGIARIIAFKFRVVALLTGGLVKGPITRDQVASLGVDNVVADGARGLTDLGITPTAMAAVLPEYLWRFRPSGQYDAIKESAQKLRNT